MYVTMINVFQDSNNWIDDILINVILNCIANFIVAHQFGIIIFCLLLLILIFVNSIRNQSKLHNIVDLYNANLGSNQDVTIYSEDTNIKYEDVKDIKCDPINPKSIRKLKEAVFFLSSNITIKQTTHALQVYLLVALANLTHKQQSIKIVLKITKQNQQIYQIQVSPKQFTIKPNQKCAFKEWFVNNVEVSDLYISNSKISQYKITLYINNKQIYDKDFAVINYACAD